MRSAETIKRNASSILLFSFLWLGLGQAFAAANELSSCALATTETGLDLLLVAERPLTFSTYWLRDPLRLVLEFPATQTDRNFALPRLPQNALLKHIKLEKGPENGGLTRLILETYEILDFQTRPDDARLLIQLKPLRLAMAPLNETPHIEKEDERERGKAEALAQTQAEEQRRLDEEAEAKRLIEEKRKAMEAARLAEEKRRAEEAAALARAEEERREAEAKRLIEEKRIAEEARLAEQKRLAEEAASLARAEEERRQAREAEAKRLAEEAEAKRLAEEKRKAAEAALAERLAIEKRQAEEAEAARQKAEASRLAGLPVKRLGDLVTFIRLGFQAQGQAAVVWFDLSAATPPDYEWKDAETLLLRLTNVRVQNRVTLYPLNTEAFGSAVRYVRPDYDPKAHSLTLAIGVWPNTPFKMEMEKRRVELLFGAAKPVLPLPPTVKLKNPEAEE